MFTPRAAHAEYKAKLKLADVFLDTFPYNCGSTTNDVIQAGVPIVTMSGRTMVSRMGGSILNSINRTDLICDSFGSYINAIKQLATLDQSIAISKSHSLNSITKGLEDQIGV
jgi:predicted O-linked N-acetylglucosamine transferase (SPINDLY family)